MGCVASSPFMLNDHLSDLSDVLDEWRESQNAVKEGRTPQPLYLEQMGIPLIRSCPTVKPDGTMGEGDNEAEGLVGYNWIADSPFDQGKKLKKSASKLRMDQLSRDLASVKVDQMETTTANSASSSSPVVGSVWAPSPSESDLDAQSPPHSAVYQEAATGPEKAEENSMFGAWGLAEGGTGAGVDDSSMWYHLHATATSILQLVTDAAQPTIMAAPPQPLPPLDEVDEPFSPDVAGGEQHQRQQQVHMGLMGRGQSAPNLASLNTSNGEHPLAKRRKSVSPTSNMLARSDSCSALEALDAMTMGERNSREHDCSSMHHMCTEDEYTPEADDEMLLPVPHPPGYESPVMSMFGSAEEGELAEDTLAGQGVAQLPDVMLTNAFGFLGRDIIKSCAICRKWRRLCTTDLDTSNLVPMSVLEEQDRNNPLLVRGAPHYAGRIVLRNDLYACWRAVSPSDLAAWEIVPKTARRFILTHASLHEIFAGPELRAAEWMELIAARFTSSMLPNQLSPVQSGRHYFFQALMQEELQLEAFSRFSAFNSLLPLTDVSLNFRVNLLVLDAESRGGQVRQVSHCGFNLPACVFANYNFSAMGAGERARMMYFSDLAGDEDSMDWFDHVPKPMNNRQLAETVPDFSRRWNAIKDIDVYSISDTDPFVTDDEFEFYEDRLVRVSWRGRFAVCFWFRLGFCRKPGAAGTNVNHHAAELLSATLGGADWARYPQYNEAYKRERLEKLRLHLDGDRGQIVGKTVVFGGIARDVYNNDDYNVSFGCGQQLVVMPLSLSDLDAFKSDITASAGARVEVYGNNACIANSDVNRLQGYDHANIEQMIWHVNV